MKKILLATLLFAAAFANAQNDNLMNYNGHWYAPNANSLDKEALRNQQLLKEKSSFDSLAKKLDVFINRNDYTKLLNDFATDERLTGNIELSVAQKDFKDLITAFRYTAQGNDEYRRFINNQVSRVLMARREGWSDELYLYVLRESIGVTKAFFNTKANTDATVKIITHELNNDARYQICNYKIAVDAKMTDDPGMQLFICDRMEYVLGADIYRYRESTPGVVTNYAKRKKESGDLYGWLFQRATMDKAGFLTMADFSHNAGANANEAIVKLNRNANWYVFMFYKGVLYYSDALPKCETGATVNVPYKQ